MGIEALSPEPPGGQGIQMLSEQERWNEKVMFRMSSLEHDPICTGFLSFFSFLFIFGKWQASSGSDSWYERKKKQSEIKILEEQFTGKQDLRNVTAACHLPPPLLYHPLSAESREWGKKERREQETNIISTGIEWSGLLYPVWCKLLTAYLSFPITFN